MDRKKRWILQVQENEKWSELAQISTQRGVFLLYELKFRVLFSS
jgi:hypothetical protein